MRLGFRVWFPVVTTAIVLALEIVLYHARDELGAFYWPAAIYTAGAVVLSIELSKRVVEED